MSAGAGEDVKRDRYLLREGHVLGCLLGTFFYSWWPPLAGVYLLVLVALWVAAWKDGGPGDA